jgi:hypothetical protein
VHSPTPCAESAQDIELGERNGAKEDDSKSSLSTSGRVLDVWQLPSLDFTPLSLLYSSQGVTERPRSSGPIMRPNHPAIISPTPERPMSSQSRRRFSKILGLDDNKSLPFRSPRDVSRSHRSLNAGKLKRVLEGSEANYPARYSIPPFSPRNSMIAESARDNESNIGSTDHEQGSGCEKSTVESLLDKHIECLGLKSEDIPVGLHGQDKFGNDCTRASTISSCRDESTIRIALQPVPNHRARAQTISSGNEAEATSSEKQSLHPRTLFSLDALPTLQQIAAQSSPALSKLSFNDSAGRPSIGWKTLASTSKLSSDLPNLDQCTMKIPNLNEEVVASKAGINHFSMTRLSTSTASRLSGDSDDLYNWNDEPPTKQRSRPPGIERQISERRRMRMRLKMKRNSRSQGRICASEVSSGPESVHTAKAPLQDSVGLVEPSPKQNSTILETHEAVNTGKSSVPTAGKPPTQQASKSKPPDALPHIPNRQSSVVAIATQRVKQSVDMARKMSIKTMRSHRSNASIVEPLNSTRLSVVAPHLGPPDLGPPLTPMSMSLNMNFAFPAAPATAPVGLRATQSFFSDDSSAVRNPRASLRKRFNLPSLRSVLPSSSPRTHSTASVYGRNTQATQPKIHQSCQMQDLKQEESEHDLYGTVGMSEFAYCRRKMLDRVKGWWRRQCVPRRLGLTRRTGERGLSEGP